MEIFTFCFMGGDFRRIDFVPISTTSDAAPGSACDERAQASIINDQFSRFDVAEATCFLKSERETLLGIIESGIGSLDDFNDIVRNVFVSSDAPRSPEQRKFARRQKTGIIATRVAVA